MSRASKLKGATTNVSDDFASVARRLECDEDKERFEEKLGKIARAQPKEAKAK